MRLLLALFIFLLSRSLQAQTLQVGYESVYDGTLYNNQLTFNDSISVWELIPDPQSVDKADELLVKKQSVSSIVLIDYIFQKKFFVTDSLHPMIWIHQSDQKEILGHQCYSAITLFRGRYYTAYYAIDIPVNGGPWKFGGLPGLIMEAVSSDGNYRFIAKAIQEAEPLYLSDYDLHEEEQLSWQDYCDKTIAAINQYVRYMQSVSSNPGSQVNLRIDRPEIIYPAAQTGAGLLSE
jgi:hypothetical protein